MNDEPIEPAPPITITDLPAIAARRVSALASISGAKRLSGRPVTFSFTNFSKSIV